MTLSDFEIYVDGIKKNNMYAWRKYTLNTLYNLGMPRPVAQKTLSIITFAAPDENFTKLDRIAVTLYNLYKTVVNDFGQECYYQELKRIGHIQ